MSLDASCPELDALERVARREPVDPATSRHVRQCAACADRIRQLRADNDLLGEFVAANAARLGATGGEGLPRIVGYALRREIQRGAQAVVYEAVQLATHRNVAIKTLLPGTFRDHRARFRFEREVEAVARLRHPSIVTLYERGVTEDGRDYLAMELVDGLPLNEYAQSIRAAEHEPAAIRRLLRIFATICQAVSAAHQRGVIHRDLKPANILVDAHDQPHVLDFGIARPLASEAPDAVQTVAGEFLGTFAYASPEQVRGDPRDIDVRSDVYALGVILYELLTQARPYPLTGSLDDVLQAILHEAPAPPGRLARVVDAELDAIVLMALRKDPGLRYHSAGALLADVQHYLAGEPINARRDSHWYLVRKSVARHKVALGAAAAVFVAAIAAATAMFVLKRQSDEANLRSQSTLMSLLQLLESDPLWLKSGRDTLPNILAEVDRIAAVELAGQPVVEAQVRTSLGESYLIRDDYAQALQEFAAALRLRRAVLPARHPDIAQSLHNCARVHWYLGDYPQAERLYREALTMRQAIFGRVHEEVARTMSHVAATLRQQGRYAEAQAIYRQALDLRRELHGPVHPDVAAGLNSLGVCLRDEQRCRDAMPLFTEALDMMRSLGSGDSKEVAAILHNLAACLMGVGELERAEQTAAESLAIKQRIYEPGHSSIAATRTVLGQIMLQRGRLDEAEQLAEQALEAQLQTFGQPHKDVADTLLLQARIHLRRGDAARAAPLLERAIETLRPLLAADHRELEEVRALLAQTRAAAAVVP